MAQEGRKGLGSHKHGVSGHAPPTPGYKMQRARDANKLAEEERSRRPKAKTFDSVSAALKSRHKPSTSGRSHHKMPLATLLHNIRKREDALADLEEVRKAVFGDVGDEPNVYADHDRLCELSQKCAVLSTRCVYPEPRQGATENARPDDG